MKGGRDARQTLGRARDVHSLDNSSQRLGGRHQQPVVGADQRVSGLARAQRHGPPRARAARADARVDDGEVHARG